MSSRVAMATEQDLGEGEGGGEENTVGRHIGARERCIVTETGGRKRQRGQEAEKH